MDAFYKVLKSVVEERSQEGASTTTFGKLLEKF